MADANTLPAPSANPAIARDGQKPVGWLIKDPTTEREEFQAPSPGDATRFPLVPSELEAGWTARPVYADAPTNDDVELPRGWKQPGAFKEIIPSDYNGGPVLFSDGRYGMPAGHQWAPFGEIYVSLYSTLPYDEEAAAASGVLPPMDPRFLIWTELALCPNVKNAALRPVSGPEHFLMDEPLRSRALAAIRDGNDERDKADLIEHIQNCPNVNHAQLRGPNSPEQFLITEDLRDRLVSAITGDHQATLPPTRDHQIENFAGELIEASEYLLWFAWNGVPGDDAPNNRLIEIANLIGHATSEPSEMADKLEQRARYLRQAEPALYGTEARLMERAAAALRLRGEDELDAKRWRTLLGSAGRVRMLGCANVDFETGRAIDDDNWVHFGAEFWSSYDWTDLGDDLVEADKASRKRFGRAVTALVDRIIERQGDAA
ncbi:hypothetical protein [Erythrobacter aureus]|uniref:Uncharacterized protein n=1 Tax=Erythrobacter aureus TaxID=2182384 RepID=A0A345YJ63_9SPHN|nr:hypothetical protein [Erythrobacter aureus]AXK43965.1 hypothetical protein DVR09_16045 [Erythrobacter aureus]